MKDSPGLSTARRGFLRTSASAGLLGAALALLSRAAALQAASSEVPPAAGDPPPGGYHETEHIRKYYAKARQF